MSSIPEPLKPYPELIALAGTSASVALAMNLTAEQHSLLAHGVYAGYTVFAKLDVAPPPPAPESPAERLLYNTGQYIGRLLASLKE